MELPNYVSNILDRLNRCGFEAYAVGGCVRDLLLGKTPKDYDITTSARPEEIKSCFSDYRVIDTGIKYGTVTIISDGEPIETTAYRVDGEYNDNRRPESVSFTADLAEDLKRRDFTVNAMAYSGSVGIVDLFGGRTDLENGIIRAIGNPAERFNEDGLRIIRALRFASCYGFKIEEKTAAAVHDCKELLKNIAGERIAAEFNKLICGDCEDILRKYCDVISVFIPELERCVGFEQHTKYHDRDIYEHTIAAVTAIPPEKALRLAMLFHDIGKPDYFTMDKNGTGHFKGHPSGSAEIAEQVLRRLKYDNETVKKVKGLILTHDIQIENRESLIKKYLNRYGEELFFDILKVHIADDSGKAPDYRQRIPMYEQAAKTAEQIIAEKQCFSLKNLDISGNDILRLNFKGKAVGSVLNRLLNSVIDGKCVNERNALIEEAKKYGGDKY